VGRHARLVAALVALAVAVAAFAPVALGARGTSTVVFVDVDQGDGVVIKIGNTVVVNDGGERWAADRVAAALRKLGADEIDVAILSHAHDDHIGAFLELIREFPIRLVVFSENRHYNLTETNRDLFAAFARADVPFKLVSAGDRFRWGGASWRILGPPRSLFVDDADVGDASVVVLLTTHGHRLLLTGDIETRGARELVKRWRYGRVDVFLATHHGSSVGSPKALLDRIRPRFTVLSTGSNGYGHPTPATIERLLAARTTIWCTDVNGSLTATLRAGEEVHWAATSQEEPWWSPADGPRGKCVGR
jgi:competence protein ComEC